MLGGIGLIFLVRYRNDFNEDLAIKFLFAITIVSLFTMVYFVTSIPDAIDKDLERSSVYQVQQKDASFVSLGSEIANDGGSIVIKSHWYPSLGFLYLLCIPIFCGISLSSLNYDFSKIFGSID